MSLSEKQIRELVEYWVINSTEKLKTMINLYNGCRYADCLYYGHMVLEMILKANVVNITKKSSPKIHNLSRLAELANIDLDKEDSSLLFRANRFNMTGRYPDEKMKFYKICDKKYTDEYYLPIINLYKKLCQKVK